METEIVVPALGDLPNLEGLVREQPDYVERLEIGAGQIQSMAEVQGDVLGKFHESFLRQAFILTGTIVPGIQLIPYSSYDEAREDFSKRCGLDSKDFPEPPKGVDIRGGFRVSMQDSSFRFGIDERRKLEDALLSLRREYADKFRPLEDNLRALKRRHEDFMQAVYDLTEVKLLTEVDPLSKELHIFVAKKSKVYHAIFGDDHKDLRPVLRPDYKLDWFSDPAFLEGFKAQSERLNTAYLVTNPSELPCTNCLTLYGINSFMHDSIGQITDKLRAELEEYRGLSPEERLKRDIGKRDVE